MSIGLDLARGLAPHSRSLPDSLASVDRRARFVNEIDCTLVFDGEGVARWSDMGGHLRKAADASAAVMPEVADQLDRVAISLRLWAGCLSAAKTITEATLSGGNTAADRARAFQDFIDPQAAADPVFHAGVEAAPAFLKLRGQPCFLDGVPADSAVRLHAKQCTESSGEALPQ